MTSRGGGDRGGANDDYEDDGWESGVEKYFLVLDCDDGMMGCAERFFILLFFCSMHVDLDTEKREGTMVRDEALVHLFCSYSPRYPPSLLYSPYLLPQAYDNHTTYLLYPKPHDPLPTVLCHSSSFDNSSTSLMDLDSTALNTVPSHNKKVKYTVTRI